MLPSNELNRNGILSVHGLNEGLLSHTFGSKIKIRLSYFFGIS